MLDFISRQVVRFRWPVIIVFVAVTVLLALQIRNAEIDPEMKSQLPPDMRARINIDKIEEIFGGTDMVMLVMTADDILAESTLKRMKKLSRGMERVRNIDRVLSLFTLKDIRSEQGTLIVDPSVKRIPRSKSAREKLAGTLKDNELVYGNVVSRDFKAAALIGFLKAGTRDEDTMSDLHDLISEVPGPEEVQVAGMPFIRVTVTHDIGNDMQRFLPIGLAIMLMFLFLCFKQLRGVLLPFLVVVMSILFSMGLVPVLGWKIQMVTIILPVILIAVANDYGIHILARYQEDNRPGSQITSQGLAKGVIKELFLPVVMTGVTTIAGLMCLLSHIVVPAKQLGVLASAGVAFALLGSLTFIPALLAILPRAKPIVGTKTKKGRRRPIERILHGVADKVTGHPKSILVVSTIVVCAVAFGIKLLVVDTDPINYYDEDSAVARSAALVDEHFGGSGVISIVAQGNVKSPKLLKQLDDLEKKLAGLERVGQTSSVAKVVRKMNRVLNTDDPHPDRIPDSLEAVAQYFLLYSMSGEPEDFERMVDFNYEHALLTARLNTLSTDAITEVMEFIHRDLEERPTGVKEFIQAVTEKRPGGMFPVTGALSAVLADAADAIVKGRDLNLVLFPVVGGFVDILADIVDAVVHGQILSLVLSLVLVSILVMLLFRSVMAGLLSAVPLSMAMALLFGLMGIFDIELNIATAMLSSIMIGVGIDYTIHYLWRYRQERRSGHEPAEAVHITLTTTGRGIVFNAMSVIVGFCVVLISNFMPVRFFGFLVVVSIGACLIGALGLLPAICLIFRPRFLEPTDVSYSAPDDS